MGSTLFQRPLLGCNSSSFRGQWWKKDVMDVLQEAIISGGDPEISDALTINGQPGDLYPCSKSGTCLVFTDKFVLLRNNLLNPDDR
ncbi:MULTI-COPPER OXIDASE [Salix viminalis]|uniref:MULTI-COPPER OXIDASE n=1 Tax=Salix viminalis TaxID=40686 RepID=A0A9Q0UTA8_SALVM|nr:MULTI-COPPER OXIDASE [Salix viminalis]